MALAKVTDPSRTSTIEEFIAFQDDITVSYHNMSFRDKLDNIIFPIKNILDDYMEELMALTVEVTMNEEEYLKYRNKPKLLAHDIYDNGELDFLILAINGMCNMKEFDSRTIKLVNNNDLDEFLTSVYNANKDDLDIYNSEIYATTS